MSSATVEITQILKVVFRDSKARDMVKFKQELSVIQGWALAYNNHTDDVNGNEPDATGSWPAAVFLVTANFHQSNPREPEHITGYVFSAKQWEQNPRTSECLVHIYATDDQLNTGKFSSWKRVSESNVVFDDPKQKNKIANALRNKKGKLGKGALA